MAKSQKKRENASKCPTCGEVFRSPTGMKVHHNSIHGSSLGEGHVTMTCELCGDEYRRHASNAEGSRFCSRECRDKNMSGVDTGSYPRSKAIERDNHTCQRCGSRVTRFDKNDPPTAEVHHIIPKAAGGPDVLENLITLCPSCHQDAHARLNRIHEEAPGTLDTLRDIISKYRTTSGD